MLPRTIYEYFGFLFPSFSVVSYIKANNKFGYKICFQVPLTLSPVTGRRLAYKIFSVDAGVTDVTRRLFAVPSSTCSTLLLAVRVHDKLFFQPIDIQQALHTAVVLIVQQTRYPCRFVILATKALSSQASRKTYTSRIQDTRYICYETLGRRLVNLEGISPLGYYNVAKG